MAESAFVNLVLPLVLTFLAYFAGSVATGLGFNLPGFIAANWTYSLAIFVAAFISGFVIRHAITWIRFAVERSREIVRLSAEVDNLSKENADLRERCENLEVRVMTLKESGGHSPDVERVMLRERRFHVHR